MNNVWLTVHAQIDLKNALIKLKDGTTPTANELTIKIGEGNLVWTEARNIDYTLNRGLLNEVREGDQVPVEATLDIVWEFLTNVVSTGGIPTPEDFLKQRGNASGYISTDIDICRPFAVDIELTYAPPCGGFLSEIITLNDFRWESFPHDLRAGTLAVTGKCNVVEPTVVRV